MGLGLYIVRTIIQLHGGEIEVRSRENEYCEFEFRIPVQNDNAVWKK
jgi:signal transduction histidine kinase